MNNIKQAFLSGLVFLGTVLTGFIGFAAYTSLPTQNTGDTINQTIWNNLINTVNSIGTKTDGIYNNGGNIGIGISNPGSKLQTSSLTTDITQNITPSNSALYLRGSDNGYGLAFGNSNASSGLGKGFIQSIVNDTSSNPNDILINPKGGNVGIGTINPSEKLDIGGGNIKMGYEIVTTQLNIGDSTIGWIYVYCPSGKYVLGGSCSTSNGTIGVNTSLSSTRYACYKYNTDNNWVIKAICANIR